jgi:hypothetical protein
VDKKILVFIISFFVLNLFLPNYIISFFGVDLKPKKDPHPIIYSHSGAKLHINNFCDSRKYGDGAFTAYKINLNQLITSNGKEVKCVVNIDYDNNELSFESDTRGGTSFLEGDLAFFGYEYIRSEGKYAIYKYHSGGGKIPYFEEKIITYIADDGYRVRIDQDLKNNNKYSVSRRIYENFEIHYAFKRNVKSLAELEKIDNTVVAYARSISHREK